MTPSKTFQALFLAGLFVMGCTKTVTTPPKVVTDSITVTKTDTVLEANIPVLAFVTYDSTSGYYNLSATVFGLHPGLTGEWRMNLQSWQPGSLPYIQEGSTVDLSKYNGLTVATAAQCPAGSTPRTLTSSPYSIEFEYVILDPSGNISGAALAYANQ
jgi:hypothetical protein